MVVRTDPLHWFAELPRFSKIHYNLYRTHLLLKRFVPGHDELQVFFITGTKGKGTVASTLASILRAAGLSTGLVTSPHLVKVTERINFQGADITEATLTAYIASIREDLPALNERYGTWVFGEIALTAALMWFKDRGADTVVIEAGLGGRLDPGNIFRRPQATCVTNVYLEHQGILGNTVAEIAAEKGGIVKPGTPFVTGAQGAALAVLRHRAVMLGAPFYSFPGEFYWAGAGSNRALRLPTLTLPLPVEFPTAGDEANLALAACLATFHPRVGARAIKQGSLNRPLLPGRFEIVGADPIFVLDVAHTPESLANFLAAVANQYTGLRAAIVASIMPDKKVQAMIEMMLAQTPHVFLAPAPGSNVVSEAFGAVPVESIEIGIARARTIAAVICVTGSFAAVRQAREHLGAVR